MPRKSYRVKFVKTIKDPTHTIHDIGGMNALAAESIGIPFPHSKDTILIAEKRKTRIPATIRHEVVERNILNFIGPPYNITKYRRAHAATLRFEKGRSNR